MLAKAVAGMNGTTFFNCSASTLVSKYRGESEKIIRTLFDMARYYHPSIIFIDEIDALVSSRGERDEHEASRRLKTEILTQMDGVTSKADAEAGGVVMVLATTNCPWDLDEALRRRLEKRIYIPLPEPAAREALFKIFLTEIFCQDDVSVQVLMNSTDGYSGADVHLICREASMQPMRRLLRDKTPQDIMQMRAEGTLQAPPVMMEDFGSAIANTRPSVSNDDIARFEYLKKSARNFGSVLIGIETKDRRNFDLLKANFDAEGVQYQDITDNETLAGFII